MTMSMRRRSLDALLLRRRPADFSQAVTLSASIGAALILLAPVVSIFASTAFATPPSRPVLLCITYVALFASALGLSWSHGVSRLGPARASQFVQLMPLFGAALSYLLRPFLKSFLEPVRNVGDPYAAAYHDDRNARPKDNRN